MIVALLYPFCCAILSGFMIRAFRFPRVRSATLGCVYDPFRVQGRRKGLPSLFAARYGTRNSWVKRRDGVLRLRPRGISLWSGQATQLLHLAWNGGANFFLVFKTSQHP